MFFLGLGSSAAEPLFSFAQNGNGSGLSQSKRWVSGGCSSRDPLKIDKQDVEGGKEFEDDNEAIQEEDEGMKVRKMMRGVGEDARQSSSFIEEDAGQNRRDLRK
jgi:hypothetical protein